MKYFSDLTNKTYTTEKECLDAERAFRQAQEEEKRKEEEARAVRERRNTQRAEAAKAVETARKDMLKAQKAYKDILENFVKEYGSYHFSTSSVEDLPHLFMSFFDL